MITRLHRLRADDFGFTIIEVIVASMLVSVVLAALGGIFISTVLTQRTVSEQTSAANTAQLAAHSIDEAMRNGTSFHLATGSDGGQLLVVRTAGSGSAIDWTCASWYYSPLDGGEIRTHVEPDGTSVGLPGTSELETWTLLAAGVSADGAPFSVDATNDKVLVVSFETLADGEDTTTISFSTGLSPAAAEESDTCS